MAVGEAEVQAGEDVDMVTTAGGGVAVIILIDSELNWLLVSIVVRSMNLVRVESEFIYGSWE